MANKMKKATIVAMAAITAVSVSEETMAMEIAMQDMAEEYGQECIIVDMDPFGGFVA